MVSIFFSSFSHPYFAKVIICLLHFPSIEILISLSQNVPSHFTSMFTDHEQSLFLTFGGEGEEDEKGILLPVAVIMFAITADAISHIAFLPEEEQGALSFVVLTSHSSHIHLSN